MIKFVIGTRAELIKIFPVILELERKKYPYSIIATGQHDIDYLINAFKIPYDTVTYIQEKRDGFMLSHKDAIKFTLKTSLILRKYIERGDIIVVHGDTVSTLAGSASNIMKKDIISIHLESGLRSWDPFEPFPEEIVRNLVDLTSNVLITVSETSHKNIRRQYPWKKHVYWMGNTIVDAVHYAVEYNIDVSLPDHEYAVVSIHRHENLKIKNRMVRIVKILIEVSKYIPLHVFMYKNTEKSLKIHGVYKYIERNPNIYLEAPTNYIEFSKWMKNSKLLITDGGSIQEESIELRVPSILLRMKTERVDGLKTGLNYLTKLNVNKAVKKAIEFLNGNYPQNVKNPYGEPGLSRNIAELLIKYDQSKN